MPEGLLRALTLFQAVVVTGCLQHGESLSFHFTDPSNTRPVLTHSVKLWVEVGRCSVLAHLRPWAGSAHPVTLFLPPLELVPVVVLMCQSHRLRLGRHRILGTGDESCLSWELRLVPLLLPKNSGSLPKVLDMGQFPAPFLQSSDFG